MLECPVCQTEYAELSVHNCWNCAWDLKPYPVTFAGQVPEAFLEKERAKIAWARNWWARSHAQLSKLQSSLEEANQERSQLQAQVAKLQQAQLQVIAQLSNSSAQISALKQELEEIRSVSTSKKTFSPIVSLDCTQLEDLLAKGKWKEADRETAAILLQVCAREREGWLRIDDITIFPCSDLRRIDQLWTKYSNGRFSFSTQQRIWQKIGGTKNANYNTWDNFSKRVGWNVKGAWVAYDHFNFSLNAPFGHLPAAYCELGLGTARLHFWWWSVPVALFSHVEACQI